MIFKFFVNLCLKKYLAVAPPKVATVKALTDIVPGTWWQEAPLPGVAATLHKPTFVKDTARGALGGVKLNESIVERLEKAEAETKAAALKAQVEG